MKVIIAGSRTITDLATVMRAIGEAGFPIDEIVSGCARGVDHLGEVVAGLTDTPVHQFPAKWSYGRSAGYRRNVEMADYADALIAVWDGQSRGTRHMIETMQARSKPVFVYDVEMREGSEGPNEPDELEAR